ncbi:MAG: hypothetical protein HY960_05960 [Ignavibacteriae bacterium]|nr:hypothetical protein [Ignavibacteriota bacterium]
MKKAALHTSTLIIVLMLSTASLTHSQTKKETNTFIYSEEYLRSNLIKVENIYKRMKEESAQETSTSRSHTQTFTQEVSSSQGVGWVTGYGIPNGIWGGIGPFAHDASGNLYIGGKFRFAGNVEVNNIAKWNGREWSALGKGIGGVVNAILPIGTPPMLFFSYPAERRQFSSPPLKQSNFSTFSVLRAAGKILYGAGQSPIYSVQSSSCVVRSLDHSVQCFCFAVQRPGFSGRGCIARSVSCVVPSLPCTVLSKS